MAPVYELLRQSKYFLLRYETEHVPCTGITAVTKQERRHFREGVMIAPWHQQLREAKQSLEQGKVVDAGLRFTVQVSGQEATDVNVLLSDDGTNMPVIYLAAEPFFAGSPTPYNTPQLRRDALVYGILVSELLAMSKARGQWVGGADWQSVPGLELLRSRYPTLLSLHNVFDAYLGDEAVQSDQFTAFRQGQTALQIGMRHADVVTGVNQGFVIGLAQDPFHRLVMARHLQDFVPRMIGVDNGPFSPLTPAQEQLLTAINEDVERGLHELRRLKRSAAARLPTDLQRLIGDRVVLVSMGRRSAQKQHDVLVECVRGMLRHDGNLPVLTIFATTGGDPGSEERLHRIEELAAEFPRQVCSIDGRIGFYFDLLTVADLNVMSSLWEPHGSAFEGLVVPVGRAVDGLLAQISAFRPQGLASSLNEEWHSRHPPSGFLFREHPLQTEAEQIEQFGPLLRESVSPTNELFQRLVMALSDTLRRAIDTKRSDERIYARLLAAALRQQSAWSWNENFAMQLALMRDARNRRFGPRSAA